MYVVTFTASSRVLVLRCCSCRLARISSSRCLLHSAAQQLRAERFCRHEKQILEGDEAMMSIIKQLSMHSIRYQFNFEASRCRPFGYGSSATCMQSHCLAVPTFEPVDVRRA